MPQVSPDEAMNCTDLVPAVILSYQSFCAPCNSMKPHLESLAEEFGFTLVCVNQDKLVSPEHAGKLLPSMSVYKDGVRVSQPLRGAHTRAAIKDYLRKNGMLR